MYDLEYDLFLDSIENHDPYWDEKEEIKRLQKLESEAYIDEARSRGVV